MILIGRKMQRDNAAAARAMIDELRAIEKDLAQHKGADWTAIHGAVANGCNAMALVIDWLMSEGRRDPARAAAAAVDTLHVFGLAIGGALLARGAVSAAGKLKRGEGDAAFLSEKIAVAHYFSGQIMPETGARLAAILDPSASALALYPRLA